MTEKPINKTSLLFVCLGNICRSPAADAIMHKIVKDAGDEDLFCIDSAGTYGGHAGSLPDPRMRAHGARRGYVFDHLSRRIKTDDFEKFDYIFAMDDSNYDDLRRLAPTVEARDKVLCIADFFEHYEADCVFDPYYGGADGFENVLNLLEDACEVIYKKLKAGLTL